LEIEMKKSVLLVAVVAALSGASAFAQAVAPLSSTFDVKVELLSRCRIATGAGTEVNFGQYTAFGAASTPAPSIDITLQCTRGFGVPTLKFDANGTDASSSTGSIAPTAVGLIAGLQYSLEVSGGTTATGGDEPTLTALGTPDKRVFTVKGTMAAGQPGACSALNGICTGTQARTLTISY
jgi:hypothetical protein